MDLKRLVNKGKEIVEKRGGVDSLKADANELKNIAKGKGSLTDKAKDAASALKDPGARGEEKPAAGDKPHAGKPHPGDKPHPEGKPHAAGNPQPPTEPPKPPTQP